MSLRLKRMKIDLLQHLKFSAIRDREDRVAKALSDTFEWIYHEQVPEDGRFKWNPFKRWLRSDSSLYWIAGKAGSGKSTLVKFLHLDPRTEEHLRVWSQELTLVIAGHFFWNSGSSIQMSVDGLIRALLHSIGTQLPDIIPYLFPDRWAEIESSSGAPVKVIPAWGTSECLQAFRRILAPKFHHFRFFFFVDGLDECNGDHAELTALFKEMAASPHIKMCLASRPWSVFQDAFNSSPCLILQHLTSRDIRVYVRTKFYEHRGFLELEKGDSKLAARLCDDITAKASGVFLWVRLAVQSLLRGIANGDRVIDLTRRLQDLPEDLEVLFHKILDSVDPAYRLHSAQLFQIHRTASESDGGVSLLRFSYADDDDGALWDDKDKPLSREEFVYQVKSMDRRLDSRTKGLLETTTSFINEIEEKLFRLVRAISDFVAFYFRLTCRLSSNPLSWSKTTPKVQYLDITLKDYIEQPEIWKQICVTTPLFSPLASLCKAYALEIKGIDYSVSDDYEDNEDTLEDIQCRIPELIAGAMFICTLADDQQSKSLIPVLDALDAIVTRKFTPKGGRQVVQVPQSPPLMMSLAIRYDIYFWIEELLKRGHPTRPSLSGAPFIFIAVDNDDFLELPGMPLDMDWDRQRIRHRPSVKCLRALLSNGADPCEEYGDSTAWSRVVDKFPEILYDPDVLEESYYSALAIGEWLDVAEIFIGHGVSAVLLRSKTTHLVQKFARRHGLDYKEIAGGEPERLCQILGVDYKSVEMTFNECDVDESEDEKKDEREDESEDESEDGIEDGSTNACQVTVVVNTTNSNRKRKRGD
jgi:hypothetical protein